MDLGGYVLDAPSSTSQLTYAVYHKKNTGNSYSCINTCIASLTLMEIASGHYKMKISEVLENLNGGYSLEGDPTTEEQFKQSFKKVISTDEYGRAIITDDESQFGVTWSQIQAKKTELETAQNNMSNKDKGKQKLKTLGLTDDEIDALVGE